jgi:uncharacterized protein YuzE
MMEREMEMNKGVGMVERVARELCRSWLEKGLKDLSADGKLGATDLEKAATVATIDLHWESFVDDAVTAIKAMREPSSWVMNEAVQIYVDQKGNVAGFEYWQRMIDAALAEPSREAAIDAALKEHEGSKEIEK